MMVQVVHMIMTKSQNITLTILIMNIMINKKSFYRREGRFWKGSRKNDRRSYSGIVITTWRGKKWFAKSESFSISGFPSLWIKSSKLNAQTRHVSNPLAILNRKWFKMCHLSSMKSCIQEPNGLLIFPQTDMLPHVLYSGFQWNIWVNSKMNILKLLPLSTRLKHSSPECSWKWN